MLDDVQQFTDYRPSVCLQTTATHTHYNIILAKPPAINSSNLDILRNLGNRVGGRTAGQVIERIQMLIKAGANLRAYGIIRLETENIPTYQKCVKNMFTEPIDWDTLLYGTPIITIPTPTPKPPFVAKINH